MDTEVEAFNKLLIRNLRGQQEAPKQEDAFWHPLGFRIESNGFPATPEQIGAVVDRFNSSMSFNLGASLQRGNVSLIKAEQVTPRTGLGGTFNLLYRDLRLYSDGIKVIMVDHPLLQGRPISWQWALKHELGHSLLVTLTSMGASNHIPHEAFANLAVFLGGGRLTDQQGIDIFNQFFSKKHLLFEEAKTRRYPSNQAVALNDAAILFYLHRRYGLDTLAKVCRFLNYVPSLDKDTADYKTYQQAVSKAKEDYSNFQQRVIDLTGSNLHKLTKEAEEWYRQNAKVNPLQPPTLAERLKNAWYSAVPTIAEKEAVA